MGTWGTALYSDDEAMDYKDRYIELLREYQSHEKAYQELYKEYQNDIAGDPATDAIFWFVVAERQWFYGHIVPEVKEKALEYLNRDEHLENWKEDNGKFLIKRTAVLNKLKEKLNSPIPQERKLPKHLNPYEFPMLVGDVYALKLKRLPAYVGWEYRKNFSMHDIKKDYENKYIVFQILRVSQEEKKVLIKFFYWCNAILPNIDEVKRMYVIPDDFFTEIFVNEGKDKYIKYLKMKKNKAKYFLQEIWILEDDLEWNKKFIKIGNFGISIVNNTKNGMCFLNDMASTFVYNFHDLKMCNYDPKEIEKLLNA